MDTVSVKEAAKTLGITEQSVRKRISVGTLNSYKDDDNRVHVYLPSTTTSTTTDYQAIYIESLEAQIDFLKQQLEDEKLASSELRRILYVQAQRPPHHQLEQPTEPSESPTTESDTPTPTGLLRRLFGR